MYHNSHPDPYAGQYPAPPPLQSPVNEQPQPQYQYHNNNNFSTPLHQEVYTPPLPPPAPVFNDYYPHQQQQQQQQQQQHSSFDYYPQQQQQQHSSHDYYPQQQDNSLDAYLRQEREEYLKNESKPQDTIPLNQDPEKAPMLESSKPTPEYKPYIAKPTLAPENEADGYKYRPYEERKRNSCNCCCYNPAITCCSFFMLLISIAFCAAGIALIIASKVISSKCDNSCNNISDSVASACNTVCNTVLQNGLFYGGIVVAGLAGIAIIWKLVMWTCAGYSQRH